MTGQEKIGKVLFEAYLEECRPGPSPGIWDNLLVVNKAAWIRMAEAVVKAHEPERRDRWKSWSL